MGNNIAKVANIMSLGSIDKVVMNIFVSIIVRKNNTLMRQYLMKAKTLL